MSPQRDTATSALLLFGISGPSLLWLLLLLSLFQQRARIRAGRYRCCGLSFEVGCLGQKLIAIALKTNCVGVIDGPREALGSHCGGAGFSRLL